MNTRLQNKAIRKEPKQKKAVPPKSLVTQKRFQMIRNTICYYVSTGDKGHWVRMQQLNKQKKEMQKYDDFITKLQAN